MAQVKGDGEHLFAELCRALKESGYLSADDSLQTTGAVLQAAVYVVDRMADDLKAAKRELYDYSNQRD